MNKKGSRGRGASEFGKQLIEKQKVRITYGLSESQFSTYVRNAMESHGANPAEILHRQLEMRLDNIIYRLGLAPTRRAARQMVSHGHITVNDKKTTIPSQKIVIGDRIAVRDGSKTRAYFDNFSEKFMERPLPSWLSWNPKDMTGGVIELPTRESADIAGDLAMVLSFYSR
jgi:small subunit ribosomal protein S4